MLYASRIGVLYALLICLLMHWWPSTICSAAQSEASFDFHLFSEAVSLLFGNNEVTPVSFMEKLTAEVSGVFESADAMLDFDIDNLLPPYWTTVHRLNSGSFEKDAEGSLVVDVWDYMERMSLYKYMIETFHHCEFDESTRKMANKFNSIPKLQKLVPHLKQSSLNFGSILWGLPLQHGWQFSSGRLLTTDNSTMIDPAAWWADMNYYLSVVPYLGAAEAGLAPKISLQWNPDPELFCASAADCPDVVAPWIQFFQLLNETKDSCSNNITTPAALKDVNTPLADAMDFNLTDGMEDLLFGLWGAHLNSIGYGLPLFEDNLLNLPIPEQTFGRSWAGIVDFIAECNFLCDLITTDVLQNLLPQRMLEDGDQIPFVEDLTRLQNRAVLIIDGLYAWNTTQDGRTEHFWQCAMCTEEGRAYGREMITLGIYRPVIILEDLVPLASIIKNEPKDVCAVCEDIDFENV